MNPTPTKPDSKVWLVDVAVPVPLRQSFTYKVPPELADTVVQGHRVLVPFRAKLMHGVTLTDAYPCDPEEVLPRTRLIASYEARQRVLAPEIRQLLDWIVRYYKAPIGEAVRLVLPPGVLSEKDPLFRLTTKGLDFINASEEARILSLLEKRPLSRKQWQSKAQAKIALSDIRSWESSGYLEVIASGAEKEAIPHTTAIVLTPEGGAVNLEELKRSPKQKELLRWLRDHDRPLVAPSDINEIFANGSNLVSQLERKGFCKRIRVPKHELDAALQPHQPDDVKILTPEQNKALESLVEDLDKGTYGASLMFGVTGAGKTEVYLRAVQHCLAQNRQALFLVPEIALTPLMEKRIQDRFGERLAILHSAVSAGRRAESWARILAGKVDVVLGARSGIFAPLPRLGLVIVDEEHDQSYKQNDGIRYHARDLALVRAHAANACVVLGSATPSLESWQNHVRGRSKLLVLEKRATSAPLPSVQITDMREEFKKQKKRPVLSTELEAGLEQTLEKGHQAMILLNRRGYHSFLLCRKCGESVMCGHCEVSLTYHRTDRMLRCHYCGEGQSIPDACPSCFSSAAMMQFFGEGTQQVQEILEKRFPDVPIDRLDRDRLTEKNLHQQILADFGRGKTRILVGTQMIAKGHDFPNVTLVGILNADQGLRFPDFRSAEVTFQLITQVAGRSGRGDFPGSVVIQTYQPEHYSIVTASKHDYRAFLEREIRYRQAMFYSPFSHMVAILVTHEDNDHAAGVTNWMAQQLLSFRKQGDLVVIGPSRAPIGKIKDAWRYQIVVKSANRSRLHTVTDAVVEETVKRKLLTRQAIILDIDPYQFF